MAHSMDDLLVRQVNALVSETADAVCTDIEKFLPWRRISMAFWPGIAPKSKGSPTQHLQAARPREVKRVWSTGRFFVL